LPTQAEKALQFKALHEGVEPFVIGNPWDAGTARILTSLGYAGRWPRPRGFPGTSPCLFKACFWESF
jgi:hypothetical protein